MVRSAPGRSAEARTWSACQHGLHGSPGALRASLPDDHPVATLLDEHQAILAVLERLGRLTESAERPARAVLEELQRLAAHLVAVESHHRREERVLFPALRERGIHGPPDRLASQHVRLRALEHALQELVRRQAGGENRWTELRATAEALSGLLHAHIDQEDSVLYPLALLVLREPSLWAELRRRCDAIGYCSTRPEPGPGP